MAPDLAQVRQNYSTTSSGCGWGPHLAVSAALANRPDKGVEIAGPPGDPPPALWPETGGSCWPSPLAAACPGEQVSAARRPPCPGAHTCPLCAHVPRLGLQSCCLARGPHIHHPPPQAPVLPPSPGGHVQDTPTCLLNAHLKTPENHAEPSCTRPPLREAGRGESNFPETWDGKRRGKGRGEAGRQPQHRPSPG